MAGVFVARGVGVTVGVIGYIQLTVTEFEDSTEPVTFVILAVIVSGP